MKLFAIGDLHLPGGQEKPMDIFGEAWKDHPQRIRQQWQKKVGDDDIVLMPGDLSWAMTLDQMTDDFAYLRSLPGTIVLIRGNHDYWWESISKVRATLPSHVFAIQNDYFELPGGIAICGTRGWDIPGERSEPHDAKIYQREVGRLQLSLTAACNAGLKPRIAMLHYPPTTHDGARTPITDLLEQYGVKLCVYGHLHGPARRWGIQGNVRGVTYHLAACDAIGFEPKLLGDVLEDL